MYHTFLICTLLKKKAPNTHLYKDTRVCTYFQKLTMITLPAFERKSKILSSYENFVGWLYIYISRKVLFCRKETFLTLQLRHSFFNIHKILNIKVHKYKTYHQPKHYPNIISFLFECRNSVMASNHQSSPMASNCQSNSTNSSYHDNQVVVVVIPFPTQGHLNQLLHLSHLILSHNVLVHYVGTATHNHQVTVRVQG